MSDTPCQNIHRNDGLFPPAINRYSEWVMSNMRERLTAGVIIIDVPFLDRHNDYLQVFVQQRHDGWSCDDGGCIMDDLQDAGDAFLPNTWREEAQRLANGFGVQVCGDTLSVAATPETFPERLHLLIQAMLVISHMGR